MLEKEYGVITVAKFKENKKKELETTLKQWKEYVKSHGKKHEHYDLTNESWWIKTARLIQEKVSELERTTDPEKIRNLLRDIFRMGRNQPLWAQNVRMIITFLDNASPNELEILRQLVLEMKKSNSFSSEWIDRFYNLLKAWNPEQVSRFRALKGLLRNILGELYGKLHIEDTPVYNSCSKRFVKQYFDFDENDYEDFKDAFEKLKQEYLRVVGKLSDDAVPINAEIDMMFNCFDKTPGGCKMEGNNKPPKFKLIEAQLNRKGQVILYGPPGTGKTWLARKYAVKKTGEEEPGNRWEFITFHQSYSYEEFIEGFRPRTEEEKIKYVVEDGIFKRLAIRVLVTGLLELEDMPIDKDKLKELHDLLTKKDPLSGQEYTKYIHLKKHLWEVVKQLPADKLEKPDFYLIIDEINRGNISKILGELITLLEKDKRLGGENPLIVALPYSGEPFAVPPNIYIIGTMNTADRSIALLDVALRRRFAFIEIEPNSEYLKDKEIEVDGNKVNLRDLLDAINTRITVAKDRDHRIGHSYFLSVNNVEDLKHVWYYEVLPLIMEYFYNDWETIRWILNGQFVKEIAKTQEGELIYDLEKIEDDTEFIKALQKVISNEGAGEVGESET